MARPKKADQEKLVNTGLSIPPEVDAEIESLLEIDGRVKGQVLRLIFMRGWAAYKKDGKFVERKESTGLKALDKPASTDGTSKPRQRRA